LSQVSLVAQGSEAAKYGRKHKCSCRQYNGQQGKGHCKLYQGKALNHINRIIAPHHVYNLTALAL
jgi:hypothetical protein